MASPPPKGGLSFSGRLDAKVIRKPVKRRHWRGYAIGAVLAALALVIGLLVSWSIWLTVALAVVAFVAGIIVGERWPTAEIVKESETFHDLGP